MVRVLLVEQPKSKLMAALREKRARLGLVRVEVWVPRDQVARVRKFCKRLVDELLESKS